MTDEKRALLGDHEAAKRLTEAGVLVMQGDCLELLKDIPDGSVDMVLTDPPYGIDYQSQWKTPTGHNQIPSCSSKRIKAPKRKTCWIAGMACFKMHETKRNSF